ncbi:hypothetical protein FQN57_006614 [Myotisia sp. PD_48]|nr:hypothetical protein FQN57_006614 [Myotisia sp. PD_48]
MSSHSIYHAVSDWHNKSNDNHLPVSTMHNYHNSTMMIPFCESVMTETIKLEPLSPISKNDIALSPCDISGLAFLKVSDSQNNPSSSLESGYFLNSHKRSQGDLSCSDLTDAVQSSSASSDPGSPRTPMDGEHSDGSAHIEIKQGPFSPTMAGLDLIEGDEGNKTQNDYKLDKKKMKRFRLTHNQTRYLMSEFTRQAHPDAAHRERLSREIPGLSPRQVQVWFQNRRAKLKRLSLDDRERMLKSRALPDDFDISQSLNSPYGTESQPFSTPLVSPGSICAPDESGMFNLGRPGSMRTVSEDYGTSPLHSMSLYDGYYPPNNATPSFGHGQEPPHSSRVPSTGDVLANLAPIHDRRKMIPNSFGKSSSSRPSISQLHSFTDSIRARAGSLNSPMRSATSCPTPPLDFTDTDSSVDMNSTYGGNSLDTSISHEGSIPKSQSFNFELFAMKRAPTMPQPVVDLPRLVHSPQSKIDRVSSKSSNGLQAAGLPNMSLDDDQFSDFGPQFNLNSFGITYVRPTPINTSVPPSSHPLGPQHTSDRSNNEIGTAYNQHGSAWLQQAIQTQLVQTPQSITN